MRTSFHHQPEAQPKIFSYPQVCRPITPSFGGILLQKSVRGSRREKLRNVRIGKDWFLNQSCVGVPDFESMLLAPMPKILLQQYRG
jgi:hypothetical protein